MPGPRKQLTYQKPKSTGKTLARVLGYMLHKKWMLIMVALFVIISSGAGVAGTYFLKPLINCIIPLIGKHPQGVDFLPFIKMIVIMGIIYLFGALSSYVYSRFMIQISNGALNTIRKDLFNSMQDLPIKYFDTHTHGELMSRYTSDVDTLREAISNGVTQLMSSAITVVGTFVMMLILSPILTLLILVMLFIMFVIIKTIGKKVPPTLKSSKKQSVRQMDILRK